MAVHGAGRISQADVERVRTASRIEAVIGDYVTLKRASAGNFKGLCPFHDEKTPSLSVSAARGLFHCFGCGEGGDVFAFLMKIDQLSFTEAVGVLAERAGITLTTVVGERGGPRGPNRSRLTAATRAAADFYADQLAGPAAEEARAFLGGRGFDADAAAHFGCGFAPAGWDSLIRYLAGKGFSIEEILAAGLAKHGQRGPIDAFHRRLLWAIRDGSGDVVGFGARRIFDDDRIEAKYVNTSGDGRLYKKSEVLYGLHLARREIARTRQVVVVEGYTDVMAMHLAGVTTAVAACGTAFGSAHIEVLRRYLLDSDLMRGEVIYVFDGDAAGQQAALKAFDSDQRFAAHTFVAIAPDGMDPCELRQARGDAALRELVRSRVPLFRFAIDTVLKDFDLDTVEGRTTALSAAAPLVARIKDDTARSGYVRELANLLGTDPRRVAERVRGARSGRRRGEPDTPAVASPRRPRHDAAGTVEREVLKLALQFPALVAAAYGQVAGEAFTVEDYRRIHDAILAAGGVPMTAPSAGAAAGWVQRVREHLPEGAVRSQVTELAVEPVQSALAEPEARYAGAIIARMAERRAAAQEASLASALQRAEASGDRERAAVLHADLLLVTEHRRALADRARGGM